MRTADLGAFLRFCGFSNRFYKGGDNHPGKTVAERIESYGLAEGAADDLATCTPKRPKRSARAILTGWKGGEPWTWESIVGFSPAIICNYGDSTIAVFTRDAGDVPQPRLCVFWRDGVDPTTFEFLLPGRPHRGQTIHGSRLFARRLDQIPEPEPWPDHELLLVVRPLGSPTSLLTGEYRILSCHRKELKEADILLTGSGGFRANGFEVLANEACEKDLQPFLLAGLITADLNYGGSNSVEHWYDLYRRSFGAGSDEQASAESALLHWVAGYVRSQPVGQILGYSDSEEMDGLEKNQRIQEDQQTASGIRQAALPYLEDSRPGALLHARIHELPTPMAEWCEVSRTAYLEKDWVRCIDALVRMAEVACHVLLDRYEVDRDYAMDLLWDEQSSEDEVDRAIHLGFGDKVDVLRSYFDQENVDAAESALLKPLEGLLAARNHLFHPRGSAKGRGGDRSRSPEQGAAANALEIGEQLLRELYYPYRGVIPALAVCDDGDEIHEAVIWMGLMPFRHHIKRKGRRDACGDETFHWLRSEELDEILGATYPLEEHESEAFKWLKYDAGERRIRCTTPFGESTSCMALPPSEKDIPVSERHLHLDVIGDSFFFDEPHGFDTLLDTCLCHNWSIEVIRVALAAVIGQAPDDFLQNAMAHIEVMLTRDEWRSPCEPLLDRLAGEIEPLRAIRQLRNSFQHELDCRRMEGMIERAGEALSALVGFHRAIGFDQWALKAAGKPTLLTPFGEFPLLRPWLVKYRRTTWVFDCRSKRKFVFLRRDGESRTAEEVCEGLRKGPLEHLLAEEIGRFSLPSEQAASKPVVVPHPKHQPRQ